MEDNYIPIVLHLVYSIRVPWKINNKKINYVYRNEENFNKKETQIIDNNIEIENSYKKKNDIASGKEILRNRKFVKVVER